MLCVSVCEMCIKAERDGFTQVGFGPTVVWESYVSHSLPIQPVPSHGPGKVVGSPRGSKRFHLNTFRWTMVFGS